MQILWYGIRMQREPSVQRRTTRPATSTSSREWNVMVYQSTLLQEAEFVWMRMGYVAVWIGTIVCQLPSSCRICLWGILHAIMGQWTKFCVSKRTNWNYKSYYFSRMSRTWTVVYLLQLHMSQGVGQFVPTPVNAPLIYGRVRARDMVNIAF